MAKTTRKDVMIFLQLMRPSKFMWNVIRDKRKCNVEESDLWWAGRYIDGVCQWILHHKYCDKFSNALNDAITKYDLVNVDKYGIRQSQTDLVKAKQNNSICSHCKADVMEVLLKDSKNET